MNLHGIVSPLIAAVNPHVVGSVLASAGYTTAPSGKRTPNFSRTDGVTMQVQALAGEELKLVDGLNIQGVKRAVYLFGDIKGVDRVEAKGGDLLEFLGSTWLVVTVLETWDTAGWCKVAVAKQDASA